jgi:hypothetical protein
MNALVKKEIRLLLPSWLMAMLLAVPSICTRMDDGIPVVLLFFGLAMLGLTSLGRESSLNTFSQLLAQPAERLRIWKIKLSVLATAFLSVAVVWRLAIALSFKDYGGGAPDPGASEAVLVAGCMVVVATFSGGLWAALLLRQVAGAFWLTLLVPATLAGFTAGFASTSQPGSGVIVALCITIGLYSLGGFLFARWLFFRAQDVGWTGGIIALPELKIFGARSTAAEEIRQRRPLVALIKKEIQLQQVSLLGAAVLLVLHTGVIILRTCHKFPRESAGEMLSIIFWMLWLVLPVIVSAMAIAEERRLGVMEGQLTLPASRRVQFAIKCLVAMFLGVFLGGVMPCLLETIGASTGMFRDGSKDATPMVAAIIGLSVWLSLTSFFASSLAKNFLQAVGFAIATFMFSSLVFPAFANGRMFFFDNIPLHSFLPLVIAVPTLVITMLWLAYWNYKNFRDGWQAFRRSLLVFVGMLVFVAVSSAMIYNRAWEAFEPAEPAHGAAKLTLTDPPSLNIQRYNANLLVKLPDGRVWFDYLTYHRRFEDRGAYWAGVLRALFPALPRSSGPQRFLSGSNWVSAAAQHIDTWVGEDKEQDKRAVHVFGYAESFGVKSDGTLWVSDKSDQNRWTADTLTRLGDDTDWQAARSILTGRVLLLKKNGTLWQWGWGTNRFDWKQWPQNWPGLRAFQPQQIGKASDWKEFFPDYDPLVKKTDGSVWFVGPSVQFRMTNYDQIPVHQHTGGRQWGACVRDDGTLWAYGDVYYHNRGEFEMIQSGHDTNWVSVAATWEWIVALKSDGTLWKWDFHNAVVANAVRVPPTRLGIHDDWVALAGTGDGVISMAADGSLWFWPSREDYEYTESLMRLPKQPRLLGNVFAKKE